MDASNTIVAVDDPGTARAITVLLEIYKENTNHGRYLEMQRELVTGVILTFASAALGALVTLRFKRDATVSLGVILISLGLVGTRFPLCSMASESRVEPAGVPRGSVLRNCVRLRSLPPSRRLQSRQTETARIHQLG